MSCSEVGLTTSFVSFYTLFLEVFSVVPYHINSNMLIEFFHFLMKAIFMSSKCTILFPRSHNSVFVIVVFVIVDEV
jgi:hypothetical protein